MMNWDLSPLLHHNFFPQTFDSAVFEKENQTQILSKTSFHKNTE